MKVLIHACPARMWYVEGFLKPELQRQGADEVEIWNDTEKRGNLLACMDSFAARSSDGGTWHIQDDVLLCRDFVERCREMDKGVVYGFCNELFLDDPQQTGMVYAEDTAGGTETDNIGEKCGSRRKTGSGGAAEIN